jgi:hypothetical protein
MKLLWFDPQEEENPFIAQALHMTPRFLSETLMLNALQAIEVTAEWTSQTVVRGDRMVASRLVLRCRKHRVQIIETCLEAPAWSKAPYLTVAISPAPPIGVDIGVRPKYAPHWDVSSLEMSHLSRTIERVSTYLGRSSSDFEWMEVTR